MYAVGTLSPQVNQQQTTKNTKTMAHFSFNVETIDFGNDNVMNVIFPDGSFPASISFNSDGSPSLSWYSSGLPPHSFLGVDEEATNLLNQWGIDNGIPVDFFDGI